LHAFAAIRLNALEVINPMTRFTQRTITACATVAAATTLLFAATAAQAGRSELKSATSWTYQLQGNVGQIAGTSADVAVIDWDHVGNRGTVEALKRKPGGGRRQVIGYLSIGEAETWRSYWKSCCAGGKDPGWLTSKTQGWKGNYAVRYWDPGWKAIVSQRLRSLIDAGFDGVYLDRADTWEAMRGQNANARGAMIQLIKEVAAEARGRKGDFAIMVQNAEELLTDSSYVSAIDAIAKEDLFHGINHDGGRNDRGTVGESARLLTRAKNQGKAIFVIEYLKGATADKVRGEIRNLGFIPFFGPRMLQGQN
jgi:cysteinyl-tRNA synthetase, unknown class